MSPKKIEARADYKVIRLILLKHQPLTKYILRSEPTVSLGFKIAKIKLFLFA